MISHDGRMVWFRQQSRAGFAETEIHSLPMEVFLLIVEQARSFEDLRVLWVESRRMEYGDKRRAAARAAKAKQATV